MRLPCSITGWPQTGSGALQTALAQQSAARPLCHRGLRARDSSSYSTECQICALHMLVCIVRQPALHGSVHPRAAPSIHQPSTNKCLFGTAMESQRCLNVEGLCTEQAGEAGKKAGKWRGGGQGTGDGAPVSGHDDGAEHGRHGLVRVGQHLPRHDTAPGTTLHFSGGRHHGRGPPVVRGSFDGGSVSQLQQGVFHFHKHHLQRIHVDAVVVTLLVWALICVTPPVRAVLPVYPLIPEHEAVQAKASI
mmetsp:Transcript_3206/g.9296  ORF Transcript_3206/g.9296 Transcript_3206/m.9296 type:complete len:248 (+) Transcript_3206:920-1663(+)